MSLRWWLSIMIAFAVRLCGGEQAATPATPLPTAAASAGSATPNVSNSLLEQCFTGGMTAVSVVSRQNASGHWLGDAWVERPAPPGRPLGALSVHLSHERRRCGDASTVVLHLKLEGPPNAVPPDYHFYGGLGYYKLHPEKLSWIEAKKVCEVEGGHLVILNSQEEADIIKKMAESSGGVILVGAHDMFSDGNFVTVLVDTCDAAQSCLTGAASGAVVGAGVLPTVRPNPHQHSHSQPRPHSHPHFYYCPRPHRPAPSG